MNETNFDEPFADFSEPIILSSTALLQRSGKSLTSGTYLNEADKKMIQKHENILHGLESDACNSMRKKTVGHILYEVGASCVLIYLFDLCVILRSEARKSCNPSPPLFFLFVLILNSHSPTLSCLSLSFPFSSISRTYSANNTKCFDYGT